MGDESQLLGRFSNQLDDLSQDIKALTAQMHTYNLSAQANDMQMKRLLEMNTETSRQIEALFKAVDEQRVELVSQSQKLAGHEMRVSAVYDRDTDNREEIGKLWQCVNNHNVALKTAAAELSTSRAVVAWAATAGLAVIVGVVGYFSVQVIDNAKELAVLHSRIEQLKR